MLTTTVLKEIQKESYKYSKDTKERSAKVFEENVSRFTESLYLKVKSVLLRTFKLNGGVLHDGDLEFIIDSFVNGYDIEKSGFSALVDKEVSKTYGYGARTGLNAAKFLLKSVGVEDYSALDSFLESETYTRFINLQAAERFPFEKPEVIDRFKVKGRVYPGRFPDVITGVESVVRPTIKDYPTPQDAKELGIRTYPGGLTGSPTRNQRAIRIEKLIFEQIKEDITSVCKRGIREFHSDYGYDTIVDEKTFIGYLPRTATSAYFEDTKAGQWFRRFAVSEKNRAQQYSSLSVFGVYGIKYFRWTLMDNHSKMLGNWGMKRDWCDDLAENSLRLSIGELSAKYLLDDIRDAYYTNSSNPTKSGLDAYYVKILGKGPNGHNPFMGIYSVDDVLSTRQVRLTCHSWKMQKGTQVITGKYVRNLYAPPHPYCACALVPIYDPNAPFTGGPSKKGVDRIKRLEQRLSSYEENFIGSESNMVEGRSPQPFLSRLLTDVMLILEVGFPEAEKVTRTILEFGSPETILRVAA